MTTRRTTRPERRSPRSGGGFTLIEVMIVIAIILALTGLITVAVFQRRDEAKRDTVKIDMNNIRSGLKFFRNDFDRWPTDEEGLKVLWDKSALTQDADATKWKKYLEEPMPNDRWGSPWGYKQVGEHGDPADAASGELAMYDLWSIGADKQEGTEDDIVSWRKESAAGTASGGSEAPVPSSTSKSGR